MPEKENYYMKYCIVTVSTVISSFKLLYSIGDRSNLFVACNKIKQTIIEIILIFCPIHYFYMLLKSWIVIESQNVCILFVEQS